MKQLFCSVCNREFSEDNFLQSHMGLHTGERPFGCDLCGKAFTQPASLQDHIKRHSDERSFKCSVCGKGFKRATERKKHEVLHARPLSKIHLPDRLKPGHRDYVATETDLLQQATGSIQGGENTMVIEVECSDLVADQIVLTTIDPSQIVEQQHQSILMSDSDRNNIPETVVDFGQ